MPKFKEGDKVKILGPVKDAVITRLVKKGRKPSTTMYMVEYTVDDELERQNPTGRRYQQPRMQSEIQEI